MTLYLFIKINYYILINFDAIIKLIKVFYFYCIMTQIVLCFGL